MVLKDRELLAMIMRRRKFSWYLKTFAEKWAAAPSNLIHVEWNTTATDEGSGARTGRLSSSPNLQNIPKSGKPGSAKAGLPPLRNYIVPPPGFVFVDRDFSGQEVRLQAHFAGGELLDRYAADPSFDQLQFVADEISKIVGFPVDRDTQVKPINYGLGYGAGPRRLAQQLGITEGLAVKVIDAYYRVLPDVKKLKIKLARLSARRDPAITVGGRQYISPAGNSREELRLGRALLNHLIQGSAGDQNKAAMIRIAAAGLTQTLSIHDEELIVADAADAPRAMRLLKAAMETDDFNLKLPFPTNGTYSPVSWGAAVKWDDENGRVLSGA